MKKNIVYIFIVIALFFMTNNVNATSFECVYNASGNIFGTSAGGTLTCKFNTSWGGSYDCTWKSSYATGDTWVEEKNAGSFNLRKYLQEGNTTCPLYVAIKDTFISDPNNINYGLYKPAPEVYFTNDVTEAENVPNANALGTDVFHPDNEHNEKMCTNYKNGTYNKWIEESETDIDNFYNHSCDSFELSDYEKENVPLAETIKKYRECTEYLTITQSGFNSMLSDLEKDYKDFHCFDESEYQRIKNTLEDYKKEFQELSENLENTYNNKNDDQGNTGDSGDENHNGNNENNEEPDYKVDTSTNMNNICSNSNYRKPARLVGVVVTFLKILVPILIILFGAIDFYKAITSQKDDGVKKAAKSIAIRAIAGVAIFLLPGLVQMVLNMVNEWSDYKNNWCCCTECILNSNCDVNSCNSESCHIEGTN